MKYGGKRIRYERPVWVPRAFRRRLVRFEAVVVRTAREIYGRAPVRLRHMGTLSCRRMSRHARYISEHALGNGIDVEGFDFAPMPRRKRSPKGMPRQLRGRFRVRVERHWYARRGVGRQHSRFLRRLATRLIDRPDIFRVLLGPAYPGHHDHFHFDCAPRRDVAVFGWDR